jgi:hypothetical protein
MFSFVSGDSVPALYFRPGQARVLGGRRRKVLPPGPPVKRHLVPYVMLTVTLSERGSIESYRVACDTLRRNENKYSSVVQPKQC